MVMECPRKLKVADGTDFVAVIEPAFLTSFFSACVTQLSEGFGSGLGSAGVPPVILWAFTPCEPTGGTPALPKTNHAAMTGIIPVPPIRVVVRNAG